MQTEKITFTEEKETLLGTLYGRAMDSKRTEPILGDSAAMATVERIDYDFSKMRVSTMVASGVALRAKLLDRWTAEFLADHPDATVLHLACGLDTRVQRIDPGERVRWFDVDQTEVIDLRGKLFPARPRYTMLATSVTEDDWLEQLPNDRPTLVVAEGLTMYLTEHEGMRLLNRIAEHFHTGQVLLDICGPDTIRTQGHMHLLRATGARMRWGVGNPFELTGAHPKLAIRSVIPTLNQLVANDAHLPRTRRVALKAASTLRRMRNQHRAVRLNF
ncbi:O-methyltransferase involved in polyketide biosynthesis [Tamaricihabitans halophyticus]|uniref:O-methyltransferase involved in polyketide biosynthesis n=1 Tax=Tamaricihabitans halophyticus TaxID=1262583 RepID=A0A4R2QVL9_9PSEU|nr:class I SAM-dependent methyltransferase [Tamaricihabitans halophyticus]TCP54113.1 O-methyltransferase involved in polyketide biosynthesis [Tamaricihabitans halophyticus]